MTSLRGRGQNGAVGPKRFRWVPMALAAALCTTCTRTAAESGAADPERWARYPASLREILDRFPPTDANQTALEIEGLSAALGIDIAPRALSDRRHPTAADAELFKVLKEVIGNYLTQQLTRTDGGTSLPPDVVLHFLSDHEPLLDTLRDGLVRGDPPRWERHIEKLEAAPIPNLLGHIWLQKLLVTDALSKAAAGDDHYALAVLDASWALSTALRDEPIVITQLIAVAVNRMQAGTLRHLGSVPDSWLDRLREHSYRESVMAALQLEGWMWTELQTPPGFDEHTGFLERVALTAGRPYFRSCMNSTADLWRRHLAKVADAESLCEADLAGLDASLVASIPWWNRFGKNLVGNLSGALVRVARLEIDLELTAKILQLEAVRRRDGVWPRSLPGVHESSACPGSRWIYEPDTNGAMSIALSREIEWRNQVGIILPTRYTKDRDRALH